MHSRRERTDRTVLLFGFSIPVGFLSWFLPLFSVHAYCENRVFACVYGLLAFILLIFFIRNSATNKWRKLLSGIGCAVSILSVAVNLAFVGYATHLCRHQFVTS